MTNLNYFLFAYILTIIATRIFLRLWPIHAHKIGKFQPHHYMHGLILIAIYFFFPNLILLGIGSALVVDELPLFFIFHGWDWPDNHWKQYHSKQTILSIVAMSLLGYLAIRHLL